MCVWFLGIHIENGLRLIMKCDKKKSLCRYTRNSHLHLNISKANSITIKFVYLLVCIVASAEYEYITHLIIKI